MISAKKRFLEVKIWISAFLLPSIETISGKYIAGSNNIFVFCWGHETMKYAPLHLQMKCVINIVDEAASHRYPLNQGLASQVVQLTPVPFKNISGYFNIQSANTVNYYAGNY